MTRLAVVPVLLLTGCAGAADTEPLQDGSRNSRVSFPDGVSVEAPCSSSAEQLDGRDNNCNGEADEGFWARVFGAPFSSLTQAHPGCTVETAFSAHCNSAAHRTCHKLGYVGGFGPVEFDSSTGFVVCLASATRIAASHAALTASHPGCTASTAFSLACSSAIHRLCVANGFVTGVGPVEHGVAPTAVCISHAQLSQVSFATLASHHDGCAAAHSFGAGCRAAIHRFCVAAGHATGFGPVEQGTDAWIACLDAE
jgi:hypothetical protein